MGQAELKSSGRQEFDSVRGQGLGDIVEEWRSFRDALLRYVENVCGVRRVGGCRRKVCEW